MAPSLLSMLHRISSFDRNLLELLNCVEVMDASVRKVMVTILRIRVFPEKGTRVHQRLFRTLKRNIHYKKHTGNWTTVPLYSLLEANRHYITSHILSSFLMSCILTIPLPDNGGEILKQEALRKEVLASDVVIFDTCPDFLYDLLPVADPEVDEYHALSSIEDLEEIDL